MAIIAQKRFEAKMADQIKAYSPGKTQACEVAGQVAIFLAGATFFGLIFASNFVKVPKWATYGVGIGAPLSLYIVGGMLASSAQSRKERQHAREDAADMTFGPTLTPVGESELKQDYRFRTRKLQESQGQNPPPSTREIRRLADRLGLDIPSATAAQILHGEDNPIDTGVQVYANKRDHLNPKKFKQYQKSYDVLRASTTGTLFVEAGCRGIGIPIKPAKPAPWEKDLSQEKQQLLEEWRKLCCYLKLYSETPCEATQSLVTRVEVEKEDWIERFVPALQAMHREFKELDFTDYVERRKQRLRVAGKALISLWRDSPVRDKMDVFPFINICCKSLTKNFTIVNEAEVVELEQAIDTALKLKRELSPRSRIDPCPEPTLVDKQWETRVAALKKAFVSLEREAKKQKLKRYIAKVSDLPEEKDRLLLYMQLACRLDPDYPSLSSKKDALHFRLRLESLNIDKIDFNVLDEVIGVREKLDLRSYAKKSGHPKFASYTSLREPLRLLQQGLILLETSLQKEEEGAIKRLVQFQQLEFAETNRYLMFEGKSRLRLGFERPVLTGSLGTRVLSDDPKPVKALKTVQRAHYKRLLSYDGKIHKVQHLGVGVGLTLLTLAISITALFIKNRYASIALSGVGLLSVGGMLYAESYVGKMLKKKRVLQMEEYLHIHGSRPVQGRVARDVKRDCACLGIDGEAAVAHAIVHHKRKGLSKVDRMRGKFLKKSEAPRKHSEAFVAHKIVQSLMKERIYYNGLKKQKGVEQEFLILAGVLACKEAEAEPVLGLIHKGLEEKKPNYKMLEALLTYAENNVDSREEARRLTAEVRRTQEEVTSFFQ